MIRHLRSNLVAYVALVLALGMGSAHAASAIANGSVTTKKLAAGAVSTPKLKANAVTGAKIRNRSVAAEDLAAGVVPRDGFVWRTQVVGEAPVATPDYLVPSAGAQVTLPRAGTASVGYFSNAFVVGCSSGGGDVGLYVDGVPVSRTAVPAPGPGSARPLQLQGSIDLSAGPHDLRVGIDCPDGDWSQVSYPNSGWTVELAAR